MVGSSKQVRITNCVVVTISLVLLHYWLCVEKSSREHQHQVGTSDEERQIPTGVQVYHQVTAFGKSKTDHSLQ